MEKKEDIWNEIREISPLLASIPKASFYTVPEHYFTSLSTVILQAVATENCIPPSVNPYTVPVFYFEQLAPSILAAISQQAGHVNSGEDVQAELTSIAPLLASISKENVYRVPEHFFSQLQAPVIPVTATPVITMQPVHRRRSWLTYAAAATITALIATSSVLFIGNNFHFGSNSNGSAELSQALSGVSDEEIQGYLNTSTALPGISAAGYEEPAGDIDIQHSLHIMSDTEIKDYLQTTVEPGETITKGI